MAPRLTLSLFGPLHVRLDGELVGGFEYNKVRALLAYLAVEAAQPHSRAHLCALLWPQQGEHAARQNLSQALSKLRQALKAPDVVKPFLLTTTESVQLNPAAEVEVDLARFNALIEAAEAHALLHRGWHVCTPCANRLRQAAALYRGDFLEQFYLRDSAPFEEWALLWRERQRQRMLSTLERLARHAEWRGAYEQAAEHTRRAVELEPWLETNQRALMRRLALGGQTTAALAQYGQLQRGLADELGAKPEPETTALYGQITAGAVPKPAQGPQPRLPRPPTRLIGREREMEAALELLQAGRARALTLLGPPGIGKTRLALELAHTLQFDYEDGAAFVDLAPLTEAALVPAAIAHALEVPEQAGQSLATTLIKALRPDHRLLLLDNFEHVVEAAGFAAELLAACPALTLLVTSRRPLGIRAEQQLTLAPLALPELGASPEEAARSPAVQVFVERLQAVQPEYRLTGADAVALTSVCGRLDGLPLAIELIAARGKSLSPTELLRQLEHGLQALAHGAPDLPPRQRTLRRAFAWSYDRLSAEEQRVFAHLGVFAGGCTLEAAQAVVGPETDVQTALEALHDSSLLQTRMAAGETRLTLLETLREFALEQLAGRGETGEARRRHLDYCLGLAEQAVAGLKGPAQVQWAERLERDHDNLRAALAQAHELDDDSELRLAVALGKFWEVRSYLSEGRRWLAQALAARPQAALPLRAAALGWAGQLARFQGDYAGARALLEQALRLGQQMEDTPTVVQTLRRLGTVAYDLGDLTLSHSYHSQSLALAREEGDTRQMAWALNSLGLIASDRGDYRVAMSHYEACLPIFWELGERFGAGLVLNNLGLASQNQGDHAAAKARLEASLAIFREIGRKWGASLALLNLGNLACSQADFAQAMAYYEQCLALCRETGDQATASYPLFGLGDVAYKQGDYPLAGSLYRQSLALRAEAGERGPIPRNLEGLAQLERVAGRPERAARLFGAAEALRERLGRRVTPHYRAEYEDEVSALRATLGAEAFGQAWAEGRALDLDAAVALALSPAGGPDVGGR